MFHFLKRFAFYNAIYVKKIIIPETVTTVQTYAFQNCNLLKSAGPIGSGCNIEFGWTTRMPSYAFHSANYLETVIIPSTLTTIRDRSFAYCSSLKYIDLPESCVTIEVEGLRGCTSLECIAIRAGNINIQAEALTGDTNLRRVYFSNSTPPKSTSTFVNITSGEAFVWVPEGSKSAYETFFSGKGYTVKEGEDFSLLLEYLDNSALLSIAQTEHWIPTGESTLTTLDVAQVTTFENIDFSNITALGELPYFKALTSIPDDCFYGSTLAGDITIPSNITSIGDSAFKGTAITNINIPNATLTEDSFADCLYLKRVDLGEDVNWATGENPFTGLGRNTKFYVNEDNENIKNSNYNDSILSANGTVFRTGSAACGIPKEVTTIESKAFKNSQKTQIVISDNITTVGADAFSGCNFNKVFCRKLTPPNFTISGTTLYIESDYISAYQTAWPNFTYYKAYKTIEMPSYRRYHIEDIDEWTADYKRLTWVGSSYNVREVDTELSVADVGGYDYMVGNGNWGNYNGNYMISAGSNNLFSVFYSGNGGGFKYPYLRGKELKSFSGNCYKLEQMMKFRFLEGDRVYFQTCKTSSESITATSKPPLTENNNIWLISNTNAGNGYAANQFKIYEAKFYGKTKNGYCSDIALSHLIPVQRRSDNKNGLYDIIRKRFFTSASGESMNAVSAIWRGDTKTKANLDWTNTVNTSSNLDARYFVDPWWGNRTSACWYIGEPGGTFTLSISNIKSGAVIVLMLTEKEGFGESHNYGVNPWDTNMNFLELHRNDDPITTKSKKLTKEVWSVRPYVRLYMWGVSNAYNDIDWSFTYE